MDKDFTPYEIALALKELGFDKPCFTYFLNGIIQPSLNPKDYTYFSEMSEINKNMLNHEIVLTPTYSQAFRFFREKYKYDITIPPTGDSNGNTIGYYYEIIFQGWDDGIESESYDTYEQAELDCLKKLIEIVKSQQL